MNEPTTLPKASAPKPESTDELKTLPMPAREKRVGSSPNGLTQAEASKRLAQYGPRGRIPAGTPSRRDRAKTPEERPIQMKRCSPGG